MTAPLAAPPTLAPEPHPHRWAAAVVMMVAALMDLLDTTIVNVAIPSIAQDLHASARRPAVDGLRLPPRLRRRPDRLRPPR